MVKVLLWLDDVRNPLDTKQSWLPHSELLVTHGIVWVKSFSEFVEHISTNGLPDFISFDHDLGNEYHWVEVEPLNEDGTIPSAHVILYDSFEEEKTGFHCAKWLVEFCLDNNKRLPAFRVHSANPVGKKNIESLLVNFSRFIDDCGD